MALATVQNVLDDARAHLSDIAGVVWTNARLMPHYQKAYRKMWDSLSSIGSNRVEREFYWNLPAYTSLLVPSNIGVADFFEPKIVRERGSVVSVAVTSTGGVAGAPVTMLAPSHGLSTNADVIVSGQTGTQTPWGRWFITVADPNNITLNGSVSDGLAGTGGTISYGSEKFTMVDAMDIRNDSDPGQRLGAYTWEDNALKFRGATSIRQLWITYDASGNPPVAVNTNLVIDNCLNFLGCYTAALAANANGWYEMATRLAGACFGPNGTSDTSDGLIRDLIQPQVLAMQRQARVMGPFRKNRNQRSLYWT